MAFTYSILERLELEKTEWVMIKYQGLETYDSGQVATNQLWGATERPIFDDEQQHIYIHFVHQQQPSKLEIDKVEYFYRGKNHPWYVVQAGHIQYTFGKFHTLQPGGLYTLLRTNGELSKIMFVDNKIEMEGEVLACNLYYYDINQQLKHLSYFNLVDVY